ncbi:MAG: hypothetical protein HY785_05670 [Oscillatoriophycideae cyanobacterium NC_groundwater_1537_Pr4_S-0.65um_50_18]|nr:hypothetical protein [Oscillatoriophycideae cyanobacterium NC_groundwater_1537_Pr4_S-0.65um_50_18]
MSYLKISWNWIWLAITQQLKIPVHPFLAVIVILSLPLPPDDNKMMLSSVNSPSFLASQLLGFVSQAALTR